MFFACELCKIIFKDETGFHDHMKRKKQCLNFGIKTSDPCMNDIIYECEKCKNEFDDNKIFIHHMKICGAKKSEKIKIHINNYLENGLENIDDSDLNYILCKRWDYFGYDPLICFMIVHINFNPKKPEHHNIYTGSDGYSYAEIYQDGIWIKKKILDVSNELIDSKIKNLGKILKKYALSETNKNRIIKVILEANLTNTRKSLISDVKLEIINGRYAMIPTRKLLLLQSKK